MRSCAPLAIVSRVTLTTHAIVGAAIASVIPEHQILVFGLAFASHFAVDAIPHWDYHVRSGAINPKIGAAMSYDKNLVLDLLSIGFDALLGIILSLLIFASPATAGVVVLGAIAGILPDPLQFAYTRWRHEPLITLQRFHQWIHTDLRLLDRPILGIASQIFFIVVVVLVVKLWAR